MSTFSFVIACPCCGERVDAEVEAEVSGGYRRATHLDPEEFPDVDLISVKVGEGRDVLEDMTQAAREILADQVCTEAQERAISDRYDAAERRYDERRGK